MPDNVIIITSSNDVTSLDLSKYSEVYSLDYNTTLNNSCIKYLYQHTPDNIDNLPIKIARMWCRDDDGTFSSDSEYSIELVLEKRISFMISNMLKLYFEFKRLAGISDSITLPVGAPKYFLDIAKIFENKTSIIYGKHFFNSDLSDFINNRAQISEIKVNRLSILLRYLQRPFIKLLYRKVIIFPDWTYSHQKNNKYIYQNHHNILKGFYLKKTIINKDISISKINEDAIRNILKTHLIEETIHNDLILLINKIIKYEFQYNKNKISSTYYTYKELLSYYKPKKVVIPDDGQFPWYNLVLQICKKKNINIVSVLDGYMSYVNQEEVKINNNVSNTLVENFATMGSLNDQLIKAHIPTFNRIMIKSPIIDHFDNKNHSKKYDYIIMMPIPNPMNPVSRWDMRYRYIIDTINSIKNYENQKIAIKLKKGIDDNISVLKTILSTFKKDCFTILSDPSHKVLPASKNVIGQAGTTIFEAALLEIPYFIYEPIYCGLSKESIQKSIIPEIYIARSKKYLQNNLANKMSVKLPKEQLTDGKHMSVAIT